MHDFVLLHVSRPFFGLEKMIWRNLHVEMWCKVEAGNLRYKPWSAIARCYIWLKLKITLDQTCHIGARYFMALHICAAQQSVWLSLKCLLYIQCFSTGLRVSGIGCYFCIPQTWFEELLCGSPNFVLLSYGSALDVLLKLNG